MKRLGALAILLAALGCGRAPDDGALRAPIRGITLADWSAEGYASEEAARAMDALIATGANEAVLVITTWQADAGGTPAAQDPRTPSPASVQIAAERLAAAGLTTVFKAHVDRDDGGWRGEIAPRDPEAWFEAYRRWLLPWVDLAQTLSIQRFVLGTELAGTLRHSERWRGLIAELRSRYDGELSYAASWDSAERVGFADALDMLGVNAWFPVARRRDAGRLELLAGWQPWLSRLRRLRQRAGVPLLFSEIGYRNLDGTGTEPWVFASEGSPDPQEQADLSWAALRACDQLAAHHLDGCQGVWWWFWPARPSGEAETGYSPRDRPAEAVLRDAFEATR